MEPLEDRRLLSLGGFDASTTWTWTDAAPVNADLTSDSADDLHPQVTTDEAGNWVAVWHSDDSLGGTIGNDSDILFSTFSEFPADFGDAPSPYPTLSAHDGARHLATGPTLGRKRDTETDGQPTANADGDDGMVPMDDEDGVAFTSILAPGHPTTVELSVSDDGLLNAWIDFNGDGDWADIGEQIFTDEALAAELNHHTFAVPASAVLTEQTFARFRISSANGISFVGEAPDGEVEDYSIAIESPVLTLSIESTSISEFGGSQTATVTRSTAAVGDLVVNLESSDTTELILPDTIIIPVGANSTSFTISVVDDSLDDGSQTVSITASAAGYGEVTEQLDVIDDDTAGIGVSPTSGLITSEAGDADQFSVVLESEPTADVRIVVYSDDMEEGTASPSALVFTAENWAEPQTVTVTGVGDGIDDGDATFTVSLWPATSLDANYRGINPDDVTVTNLDFDTAAVSVDWLTQPVTTEAGGSATFELVLDTEPTRDVTVYVASSDATEGKFSPPSLVFTTLDWNEPRTVRVTGVDDDVDDGDVEYSISMSVSSDDSAYSALPPQDVAVVNRNDDSAGVSIDSAAGLTTEESGEAAAFTVVLDSEPVADVTVTVASDDETEGAVTSATLSFTPDNWDTPQSVTVAGVEDDLDDGNVEYAIRAGISSDDSDYNGPDIANVTITNLDDDTAGITVTPTSGLATDETLGTATFTVALTSEPVADVTVGVATDDSSEGTIGSTELVFTPATWQQPQTVTITGVDDHVDDDDVTYTIVMAAAVSSDPNYSGLDAADVVVTNEDDETFTPVELGQVDFTRLESLNPSVEDVWLRLETVHDGWLTVQAVAESTAEELTIRVLEPTNLAVPVATSTVQDGRPRLDHGVEEGQVYLLQLTGTASNASLLLANLVHEAGGAVTVHGTAEADVFRFDAAVSREITINEVAYHYEDTEVSTIDFAGGEGRDVAWFYGSAGDESLEAWPDGAIFANGAGDTETDFTVQVSGIEDLLGYATQGGTDSAIFHGSEAGDKLKSYDDSVRLRAKDSGYTLRGKRFATIVADAGDGGKDLAVFNGTDGDETFTYLGADGSATVEGKRRNHAAVGFASVTARAGGDGNDVAHFTDIPGPADGVDDVFYFKSHKTQLVGSDVKIAVRAFDQVYANANESGFDVARIYDTAGDEHLKVEGNTARLYRRLGDDLELLYEVVAFERAKCYSTGGDDTTDVRDHVIDLHLHDWDE